MADPRRHAPTDEDEGVPPAAAEGKDPYPTYRDGPVPPHPTTTSRPTDVGLPQSQRTRASPMLIGLIVFALVVLAYLLWGGLQMTESTDEAAAPGDAATSAATAPAEGEEPTAATDAPEAEGTLDQDVEAAAGTGPGEVGAVPGPADVPGGDTTTPAAPAPQ